jgi:hypothetical protein
MKLWPTMIALPFLVFLGGRVFSAEEPGYRFEDLARMSWAQLECIYRQAPPGRAPMGFAQGRVIYCSDAPLAGLKNNMSHLMWKGKHFCAEDATLINQWCGVKAIRANVYEGTSWLDGKPAIIFDYSGTSKIWADMRDETREIAPGLYLGMMHQSRCPEPKLKLFFVLKTCQ